MEIIRDTAGKLVKIRMLKPSDMHQHLRDDDMLKLVAPMVAKRFWNIVVMPNLKPPITTGDMMDKYYGRIQEAAGDDRYWLMMLFYLTDTLDPSEVGRCLMARDGYGVKYYPRGLTTNSDSGVSDPASLWTKGTKPYEVLRAIADADGVLCLHAADGFALGEWMSGNRSYRAGDELDPYDQEPHFIKCTLPRIMNAHRDLKISVEHMSTADGVQFMRGNGGELLGCSLTAQHLLLDRRDSFRGGFRPHRFWWPIIQPKEHRDELRKFASEGHPFVWLGSDSAPHPIGSKENDCCTGGVLVAHAGIELYIEAFEDMGCLDKLEDFACRNGPRFFDESDASRENLTVELVREEWEVKSFFIGQYVPAGGYSPVIPFRLGETVRWKLAS